MVVSRAIKFTDFVPFVFRHFVNFALLRRLVGILGTNGEQVVIRTVFLPFVQVGHLMPGASVVHRRAALRLIRLLVYHVAVRCDDRANLIFFLLSADAEDFVVYLDTCEFFWKNFSVAKPDLERRLRG